MEYQYLDLLKDVLKNGDERIDRTGVGTYSLFGKQIRHHLKDGFPLLTTKKISFNSVLAELLWFIEGSNDERRLAEITHGTRDVNKRTIWTDNASSSYWLPKAKFEGDLGRIYGVQWRTWKKYTIDDYRDFINCPDDTTTYFDAKTTVKEIDQLQNIIDTLKTNPTDRRMVLSAFNVGEIDQMALPPCHMFAQFHVNTKKNELNCQVYLRSNDLFLGLPYNIASYALLTHMIATVTNFNPGELIITIGDAHIYKNHIDQVNDQIKREPSLYPTLIINNLENINDFSLKDFSLKDYNPLSAIKAPMAV